MKTEAHVPSKENLNDWMVGATAPTDNHAPNPESEGTIYWDLRPKGEVGNIAGAGSREIARLRNLENVGAVAWSDEVLKGSGTVITQRPGMTIESHVIACEPIPASELAPHQKDIDGVVTPLWPIGKAINLPTEE